MDATANDTRKRHSEWALLQTTLGEATVRNDTANDTYKRHSEKYYIKTYYKKTQRAHATSAETRVKHMQCTLRQTARRTHCLTNRT